MITKRDYKILERVQSDFPEWNVGRELPYEEVISKASEVLIHNYIDGYDIVETNEEFTRFRYTLNGETVEEPINRRHPSTETEEKHNTYYVYEKGCYDEVPWDIARLHAKLNDLNLLLYLKTIVNDEGEVRILLTPWKQTEQVH